MFGHPLQLRRVINRFDSEGKGPPQIGLPLRSCGIIPGPASFLRCVIDCRTVHFAAEYPTERRGNQAAETTGDINQAVPVSVILDLVSTEVQQERVSKVGQDKRNRDQERRPVA